MFEVKGLQKSYHQLTKSIPVLRGIDLELEAGKSLAITGSSGVGKSTFLHCVGLLDSPDAGEILVDHKSLSMSSSADRAKARQESIGFVFQFHYLMAELTALENVMLPMMITKLDENQAEERAKDWLHKVGLEERLTHRPAELSGGEQQRVAIARALVREPKVILADEPTGNLDPSTARRVFDVLVDRARDLGACFIMATHNLELAAALEDQKVLKEGVLQ